VGTILRARGPVVDVQFEIADLPDVLENIVLRDDTHKREAILEVVQRRGHGVVRCLATSAERIPTGMRARRSEVEAAKKSPAEARAAIASMHHARARGTKFLETGIKAIDLLCPLCTSGSVAIVGDAGVGKLVLVQELARRLTDLRGGIGVFTFVRLSEQPWARSVAAAMEVRASAPDLTFFLATESDEPHDPADVRVDTLIHFSTSQAEHHIYPAIDPVRSRSSLRIQAQVGRGHCATAEAVRNALKRLGTEEQSRLERKQSDDVLALRALKLRLYLSQPLFVAQPFTKLEGAWVPRRDTLAVCREILDGRHDHVPPAAFWFVGGRPRGEGRRASATR
jgi:F0F1-type ATP synthase beta subunit